jgi:hypothetical protein
VLSLSRACRRGKPRSHTERSSCVPLPPGFTSPIAGGRYRFEVLPVFGGLTFGTLLPDYRRYLFVRPITVAVRGLHYGRYGADAERSDGSNHCSWAMACTYVASAELRIPLVGPRPFALVPATFIPIELSPFRRRGRGVEEGRGPKSAIQ